MPEFSTTENWLLGGDTLDVGGGGSSEKFRNPDSVRAIAAFFAILATTLSTFSVWSHLKNYRKPVRFFSNEKVIKRKKLNIRIITKKRKKEISKLIFGA